MDALPAALAELFAALARHDRLLARGDDDASRATAVEVGGHVAHVVSLAGRPLRTRLEEAPPRPVAVAMAQALFTVPHLSRTLSVYTTVTDAPIFHPTEPMAEALGLPLWELEEIRNEADLRVSIVLKQIRALHWLWSRGGNPRKHPETLFHMLFPGAVGPEASRFVHRGARLYAVVPQPHAPPPEALYLRWLPGSTRWSCKPDSDFSSRFVDPAMLRSLGKAVGADDDEVAAQLDNLVCTIPESDDERFILRDRWRSEAWAHLSGLGQAHPGTEWLPLPLAPDALDPVDWLVPRDGGLALQNPRQVFDRHAMSRLTALMHDVYAEICARLLTGEPIDPHGQAWLFDLDPYIQRVLQPLLDWASDDATHAHLARELAVSQAHVASAMARVREGWMQAARTSWGGPPKDKRPWTVQAILAAHLAVSQAGLHRVYRQDPDPRADHRKVLLLFYACFLKAAPLGRLWRARDGRLPPPEDVVGEWFWGTWMRVLEARELDE